MNKLKSTCAADYLFCHQCRKYMLKDHDCFPPVSMIRDKHPTILEMCADMEKAFIIVGL